MLRILLTLIVFQTDSVFFCLHIEASLADENHVSRLCLGLHPRHESYPICLLLLIVFCHRLC